MRACLKLAMNHTERALKFEQRKSCTDFLRASRSTLFHEENLADYRDTESTFLNTSVEFFFIGSKQFVSAAVDLKST